MLFRGPNKKSVLSNPSHIIGLGDDWQGPLRRLLGIKH